MYVSVPKALISTMQGFQTILLLNVWQCSKGTHQYHARVSNNISTQCMSMFQRHSLVTCKGFKQYQYSMYVSVPKACKAFISTHAGQFPNNISISNNVSISVPKALISTMQGFQRIFVLNVCQCSKGAHQYHARVSTNISTQCMSVFQRHPLAPLNTMQKALISQMQGFKQYQYSMYVSVPKALQGLNKITHAGSKVQ